MDVYLDACQAGDITRVKEILSDNIPDNVRIGFHAACINRQYTFIKWMINNYSKYDIEFDNLDINYGVLGAIQSGEIQIVKYLLKKGADEISSFLLLAAFEEKFDIIKYIIKEYANEQNKDTFIEDIYCGFIINNLPEKQAVNNVVKLINCAE